jgi:GTP-binding protein
MKIKSVEFAGAVGAPGGKEPPGALPQVAFAGRSNVGKSSLINRLLGRTRTPIARVSATPGKTREINFFRVRAGREEGEELSFHLVDLPGYGYARVPLEVRGSWRALIEGYLERATRTPARLRGVAQLIDVRHGPSAEDARMLEYLAARSTPTVYVLTKVDKLGKQERARQVAKITETLGADPEQVIPFSAESGEGREALLEALEALLVETGGEA